MQTDQYNSQLWHVIVQQEENTLGARDRRVKSYCLHKGTDQVLIAYIIIIIEL
jgi:hypothetical protein